MDEYPYSTDELKPLTDWKKLKEELQDYLNSHSRLDEVQLYGPEDIISLIKKVTHEI